MPNAKKNLSKEDKIREWSKIIDQYVAHYKYLKEVGKTWISQGNSAYSDPEVQEKLCSALKQIDSSFFKLKQFVKPRLTKIDTSALFIEDRLQAELDRSQKRSLDEGDSLQLNQALIHEVKSLRSRIKELEDLNKSLLVHIENVQDLRSDDGYPEEDYEELRKKLENCEKDRDLYKALNEDLEKKIREMHLGKSFSNRSTLQIADDFRKFERAQSAPLKALSIEDQLREFEERHPATDEVQYPHPFGLLEDDKKKTTGLIEVNENDC